MVHPQGLKPAAVSLAHLLDRKTKSMGYHTYQRPHPRVREPIQPSAVDA
jgi:hypothetical protein